MCVCVQFWCARIEGIQYEFFLIFLFCFEVVTYIIIYIFEDHVRYNVLTIVGEISPNRNGHY